ncbi:type I-E CRISPR-associated protein Cse2/CasB [Comamonas serinivorans]|uniref:Type I-E CRISPR-associated protein Cse2/CasB n=1 Tax=Comamonas serinivorans TaxID=1082851 RepID=A0A1Y0EL88_9BURK|nr:type I-E CRISPR-associated protein Cse2/CasB [Comamonas serinivorans]ARU04403.1 type I-E CRISPR-associated protein Cse2/CasB [Comamonas serinivorans]
MVLIASSPAPQGLPPAAISALVRWWKTLVIENPSGQARADRAVLRRAHDLTAVACLPAYQRVYRSMAGTEGTGDWPPFQQERIAAIVALLAHVKADSGLTLPRAMSLRAEGSDRNPVSELRFRRLLDAGDVETLFAGLRRALPLVEHRVDPESLAKDVFFWGDGVKKRWAYDYAWSMT